jgi:hypothetical protein
MKLTEKQMKQRRQVQADFAAGKFDFGDPTPVYKRQAKNYRREAISCAEKVAALSTQADPGWITTAEIERAKDVVGAWADVVAKLKEKACPA